MLPNNDQTVSIHDEEIMKIVSKIDKLLFKKPSKKIQEIVKD